MASQPTKMFSKKLKTTDINKRLAIPGKILPSLPAFNGGHAVLIQLKYGTKIWPIGCTVRKNGYKKPVFSVGWRKFVADNKLKTGDIITMYKDFEDGDGGSHFRVEVEKRPAASNQDRSHETIPSSCVLAFNDHEVDGTNSGNEADRIPNKALDDGAINLEGGIPIMEFPDVATDTLVDGHVIAKPSVTISGAIMTDEMKCLGITKGTDMGEPSLLLPCRAKAEREIDFLGIAEGGDAIAYGSGPSDAAGEACCNFITHHRSVTLDLVLSQPNPYNAG
ncbi:hypothetical protein E1A91_A04G169700v1 [Gossypium mustelinum]|uniref:TF-B3 domain-containing protein n=4 Tax=Gossypium TaxID=3633 RepID=A0A5J5W6D9_GOSBA|nr:hypothetical protein ES319_A04G161300v1 [Gossypium barbadense]TYH23032.1 hypothetical protein ES288_A04G177800v1 [Gossypium darwinii]TYI34035.1 hypothetical protein ES332_A04G175700v1 [Gossypium tomentosum]TYJ40841.1 hypothetical protein E1A91_A04G169700v1 [Gossypium mustelinum]